MLVVSWIIPAEGQINSWRKKLANKNTSLRQKITYCDSLMMVYRRTDPDSSIFFAHQLFRYGQQAGDTSAVDFAMINLGSLHRIKGDLDSARYYYAVVLESYKLQHFDEGIASVYHNMANIYKLQSRYDLAIKNYYEALDILKTSKRYNARANVYSNFAGLYYKLENYDKALELWEQARKFYLKGENQHEVSHVYRGIGRIYIRKNEPDKAIVAIQKALELDRKNNIHVFIPEDLLILMEIYSIKGNIREIEKIHRELKTIIKNTDVLMTRAAYYEFSGDFEMLRKNPMAAILLYDSSLVYLNSEDAPETKLNVLHKKMAARLKLTNTKGLEQDWEEIRQLEKTVAKLRQDRITQETDATYNLRDKEELIGALNQRSKAMNEVVVKERELKEQRGRQLIFLWAGILVVCFFAIYILLTNRKLSSTKKELEKNIEQKDFLFKELNHRVKNNLHIVSSFLGIEMHGKTDEVKDIIKTCDNRIHSLVLVHEMLYQTDIIEKVELKPYFEKLASYISGTLAGNDTNINITVPESLWISSNKAVLIGLIVNELLTNAIKYAKHPSRALQIHIEVAVNNQTVLIGVSDNGIGLANDFVPGKNNSMGMKLAYGLTQQLNGNFDYKRLDQGSSFQVSFEENQKSEI